MKQQPPPATTTFWDFPSRTFGAGEQGDNAYKGATPAHVIWNLLVRYTKTRDLVVDPMAGSGTTLDVARQLKRRALGYDTAPQREDIFHRDARDLPLADGKADFLFLDPPYSTHIRYSDDARCIGRLPATGRDYYRAMDQVIREIFRILKPNHYMGLYICDSFKKDKYFIPLGFKLFSLLQNYFTPVDIVCVKRYNRDLHKGRYHQAALEHNYFLRGFNYLFIMHKPAKRSLHQPRSRAKSTSSGKAPHKRRRS